MAASRDLSLPKTMKAVFWAGQPFEVAVKQTPFPKILQPGDAIVRLTTTSICGSDLHTYHGVQGSPDVPYSMGHEGVGVVVEVGHGVKAVKVGNRVIVPDVAVVGRFDPNPHLNFSSELFGGGSIAGDLGGTQGMTFLQLTKASFECVD
jgi:threonine dehydrogenase-like Zn-dependent dehydrogenase